MSMTNVHRGAFMWRLLLTEARAPLSIVQGDERMAWQYVIVTHIYLG